MSGGDDPAGLSGLIGQLRHGLQSAGPAATAAVENIEPPPAAPAVARGASPRRSSPAARAAADRLLRSAGHAVPDPDAPSWSLIDRDGRAHALQGGMVMIGRVADRDTPTLVVTDDRVSRRHASVLERAGQAIVSDLGSTNGTRLQRANGMHDVGESGAVAKHGDLIVTADGLILATVHAENRTEP